MMHAMIALTLSTSQKDMCPSSPQAAQLDVPPKPDLPDMDGILLRMEETGKWVSSSYFFYCQLL